MENESETKLFLEAQTLFKQRRFSEAEELIERYKNNINYSKFPFVDTRIEEKVVDVSVVIVAYNTKQDLIACISSLQNQTDDCFEIIVVDNGGNESVHGDIEKFNLLHIKCPINFILSEGRNIGAKFAKGEILAFLDDDAVVSDSYIELLKTAFQNKRIVGIRGKVLPKTQNKNNMVQSHYSFGEKPFPYKCNAEGASAFRKKAYLAMGGMNPLLFGEEGTELSSRLTKKYGLFSVYYWPKLTIFHDYATTDDKLQTKSERHILMEEYIKTKPYTKNHLLITRIILKILKLFGYANN